MDQLKLAQYKLVSEPMYALTSLKKGFTKNYIIFDDVLELISIYDEYNVTPVRVLSAIECDTITTPSQEKFMYFLRTFVRESTVEILKKLLRFVTGIPTFTCSNKKINVAFSGLTGLTRVPQASVCGKTLILPSTYSNYTEFKEEFVKVLTNDESYLMLKL